MTSDRYGVNVWTVKTLLDHQDDLTFHVPEYQRAYEWREEQVDALWSDITDAIDEKAEGYLMGAIILRKMQGYPKRRDIVDGQQRLATLTSLLSVLRDNYHEMGEAAEEDDIQRLIMKGKDEKYCTLELSISDRDNQNYLINKIQAGRKRGDLDAIKRDTKNLAPTIKRDTKNRLSAAHERLKYKVKERLDGYTSPTQKKQCVDKIVQFVTKEIFFIVVIVESDTDAYTVFETLNDRGLELSVADLVKNFFFLFGNKHGNLEQVRKAWDRMQTHLAKLKGNDVFSQFLRCYWLSVHGIVSKRVLFKKIKEFVETKNGKEFLSFVEELANETETYVSLIEPVMVDHNSEELNDFAAMGILQHLPLLLAAKRNSAKQEEFSAVMRICESITMRYLIVGSKNPNKLEQKYSSWARKVRGEGLLATKIVDIRKEAEEELYIDDNAFTEGFKLLAGLSTPTNRYILRKINRKLSGDEIKQPSVVNIEHILPQNPSDGGDWIVEFDSIDERKQQVVRLGNLTLLHSILNKKAANKSFEAKKNQFYVKSNIWITKDLDKIPVWNKAAIDKRQNDFAEIAVVVWAL